MASATTLPQKGSYTLSWASLPTNTSGPMIAAKADTGTVTYEPGKVTLHNQDGSTYASDTYDKNSVAFASTDPTIKIIILQYSGGYYVIADPSIDLYDYTFLFDNSKPQKVTLTNSKGNAGTLSSDSKNAWDGTCFLSGTMIRTVFGHIAVEDLKPGMEILTFDKEGHSITKKVQWVGKKQISRIHPDFELEKAPVRIKKDAIALNVPFKDCLLTPEHCLFINGCFVPVRMLVNNKSIYYDRNLCNYEYFHVELEDHSILESDGLFSESYLKTSDREFSSFEGSASTKDKTWEHDAAAPLNVDRTFVEPLYRQFSLRADALKFPWMERKVITSSKIYIMDQKGNKVYASKVSGNKHLFHIKNGSENVFIRSDSGKPSEFIGSFVDDRRDLGLLIGQITILTSNNIVKYTKHLEDKHLFGWNDIENTNYRWTNGNAQLLELGTCNNYFIILEILEKNPSVIRIALEQDNTDISAVA